jgi:hypothetical protein
LSTSWKPAGAQRFSQLAERERCRACRAFYRVDSNDHKSWGADVTQPLARLQSQYLVRQRATLADSMPTALSIGRACARVFIVASLFLTGCGETTQTVGQTRAEIANRTSVSTVAGESGRQAVEAPAAGGSSSATPGKSNASVGASGADSASAPSSADQGTAGANPLGVPSIPTPGCMGAIAATHRALDLYLMVDTNISLPVTGAWNNVRSGLARYVDDSCAAGVGVGVRYFGVDCNAMGYATPTTPVAQLPQNADAIKQQTPITPFNLSPTVPALEGALIYSRSRAATYPDSKQAVVLVSDGFVDFYCQDATGIQAALTGNASASPSIPIYVLALDVPSLANIPALSALLDPITRFNPLDTIAKMGNTGTARRIDLQASAATFAKAMVDIQHDAQPCDYSVPDAVRVDPSSMVLAVNDAAGGQTALPLSPGASACGAGYYFGKPSNPAWATLCPATCADVKARCADLAWVTGCKAK